MFKRLKILLQEELRKVTLSDRVEVATPDLHAFVARQPVFDKNNRIWGYELLYRRPDNTQSANFISGTAATASVIINGFEMVRPSLKKKQKVLINFTSDLLETQISSLLPVESCIVEILEDVQPTPEVLQSIAVIKEKGYTIALDDYVGQEHLQPFIPLSDIIKIDVLDLAPRQIAALLLNVRGTQFKGLYLAEKVEDQKTATVCRELGFSLFQGYFFSKPELLQGKRLSPSQAVRMRILSLCVGDNVDLEAVSDAVMHDPLITARFLKFINSAYFSLRQPIQSVRHALAIAGPITFMQWLCVNILTTLENSRASHDLAYLASQRAKFLESLGSKRIPGKSPGPDVSPPALFLTGLFSLLESALHVPLKEILDGIPLDDDIVNALHGKESPYSAWLKLVHLYEHGQWQECIDLAHTLGLSEKDIAKAYAKAMDWGAALFPTDSVSSREKRHFSP